MMIISPDEGGTNRAVYLANVLGLDMGMFYKRRDYSRIVDGRNPIVAHEFLGSSVEGKDVIIIDDMISSGESMIDVATELKKRKDVYKRQVCNLGILCHDGFIDNDILADRGICHNNGITDNTAFADPYICSDHGTMYFSVNLAACLLYTSRWQKCNNYSFKFQASVRTNDSA